MATHVPTAADDAARTRPVLALGLALLAVVALYLLLQENGAVIGATAADYAHEITHDARHALGVPCH